MNSEYQNVNPSISKLLTATPVLVTTISPEGSPNVFTVSYVSGAGWKPPMIMMSLGCGHLSTENIRANGMFVINVVGKEFAEKAWIAGRTSGRKINKFEELKLQTIPSITVKPPRIIGAIMHLEGQTDHIHEYEKRILILGRILHATVISGKWDMHSYRSNYRFEKTILTHGDVYKAWSDITRNKSK